MEKFKPLDSKIAAVQARIAQVGTANLDQTFEYMKGMTPHDPIEVELSNLLTWDQAEAGKYYRIVDTLFSQPAINTLALQNFLIGTSRMEVGDKMILTFIDNAGYSDEDIDSADPDINLIGGTIMNRTVSTVYVNGNRKTKFSWMYSITQDGVDDGLTLRIVAGIHLSDVKLRKFLGTRGRELFASPDWAPFASKSGKYFSAKYTGVQTGHKFTDGEWAATGTASVEDTDPDDIRIEFLANTDLIALKEEYSQKSKIGGRFIEGENYEIIGSYSSDVQDGELTIQLANGSATVLSFDTHTDEVDHIRTARASRYFRIIVPAGDSSTDEIISLQLTTFGGTLFTLNETISIRKVLTGELVSILVEGKDMSAYGNTSPFTEDGIGEFYTAHQPQQTSTSTPDILYTIIEKPCTFDYYHNNLKKVNGKDYYTARFCISQDGTNDPSILVLENDRFSRIQATRESIGKYYFDLILVPGEASPAHLYTRQTCIELSKQIFFTDVPALAGYATAQINLAETTIYLYTMDDDMALADEIIDQLAGGAPHTYLQMTVKVPFE